MKRSILSTIGLVIALTAAIFCVGWSTTGQSTTRTWEYEVLELHAPQSHSKTLLAQRGQSGWELVSVVPVNETDTVYYYFKRAK